MVLTSALIFVIIIAIAFAGCSSKDTAATSGGAGQASSGVSSAPAGAAAPAAAGGNCPAVDAVHSWNGKWDSKATSEQCLDLRTHFYPPTKDNPDPWGEFIGGGANFPLTFTQTGCDVAGSITIDTSGGTMGVKNDCPMTLTGKVDSKGVLSGTWKTYCGISFRPNYAKNLQEEGVFTLWMEPGGTSFVGTFSGNDPDIAKNKAESCPSANGNWVGKRA